MTLWSAHELGASTRMKGVSRKSTNPDVSVIIVTYNCASYIRDCIESVLKQTGVNLEIIVVDNASTDSTREILQTFEKEVECIFLGRNFGLAVARNLASSKARAPVLCFLDPDVFLKENAILQALLPLSDSKVGTVYGANLVAENPTLVLGIGIDEGGWHYNEPITRFKHPLETLYALGGFFLLRKSLWNHINQYDVNFFFGWEEVDLGWRIWMVDYKVVFVPTALCYHIGRTLRKDPKYRDLTAYSEVKGFLYLMFKNLESKFLAAFAVPAILSATWVFLSASVRYGTLVGSSMAVKWVFANVRSIFAERVKVQSKRKVSDARLFRYLVYLIFPLQTARIAFDLAAKQISDRFQQGAL